jgi:hypothetical protein
MTPQCNRMLKYNTSLLIWMNFLSYIYTKIFSIVGKTVQIKLQFHYFIYFSTNKQSKI